MTKKRAGKRGKQKGVKKDKFALKIIIGLLFVLAVIVLLIGLTEHGREFIAEITEIPAPPTDAIYIEACQVLDQAGAYYVLNTSLSNIPSGCFSITAADITLDGIGNSIQGSFTANGVQVSSSNAVVMQLSVSNFDIGVALVGGSQGSSLVNVDSFNNVQADIYNVYDLHAQINTLKEDYYPGEDVEITDASELDA